MVILMLLTSVALPLARVQIERREKWICGARLRQLRDAIDRYKDFCDRGMIPSRPTALAILPISTLW